MKTAKKKLNLSGNLWFNRNNDKFLGGDRIRLLEKIDELGSITKAAKAVGICYKTAWDTVNAINNLAEKPLVDSLTGGKGGGGTKLTPAGREIVTQFNLVQQEMARHLEALEEKLGKSGSLRTFLRRNALRVSARNIFHGTIGSISTNDVNAEVTLLLKGDVQLTSVITKVAVEDLGLTAGMDAYAIVKASSVIIASDLNEGRFSSRNMFSGTVVRVIEGPITCEVDLEIGEGTVISATITRESLNVLGLREGSRACALIKSSSVILGVN